MSARNAFASAILVLSNAICLAQDSAVPNSRSPDGRTEAHFATDADSGVTSIFVFEVSGERISDPVSLAPFETVGEHSTQNWQVLWNDESSGVAIVLSDQSHSQLIAFVRTRDHRWVGLRISHLLNDQIGKLGRPATDFLKIQHEPYDWSSSPQSSMMFWVKSQLWDASGQKYTLKEPILISQDGSFVGR